MHQNPTKIALSSGGITEKVPRVTTSTHHQNHLIEVSWLTKVEMASLSQSHLICQVLNHLHPLMG